MRLGSLSHYLQGFFYIPGINFHVCQGFKENKRFSGVCKLRVNM